MHAEIAAHPVDDVAGGCKGVDVEFLRRKANQPARLAVAFHSIYTEDFDSPGRGIGDAGDAVNGCRFPCAVRAEKAEEIAGRYCERKIGDSNGTAFVDFAQSGDGKGGRHESDYRGA
jgi:hypothetical protein